MEKILQISKLVALHGPEVLAAVIAILSGVIAISLLIPGEQPEKALKAIVGLLEKISVKPKKEDDKK